MTIWPSSDSKFKNKLLVIAILFSSFLFRVDAQYFHNGQEPASTHWRQVQTEMFQVIYPDTYEAQGKLLAHWLMQAYQKVDSGMQSNPRKISVILHGKTTYSNGMVMWAPRRVELYNTPSQDMIGQNWMQHLVIHEYRHVVQVEKMNQGFNQILSWLLGQQATVVPLGLYMPMWFLEGDAVTMETALTNSGRGRNPEFLQGFKALIMEKGAQKYERALLGSYKMYTPNHYETGYQMAAISRIYKSPDVFERKLDVIAKQWGLFFLGDAAGLRDGKKKDTYYAYALKYLVPLWEKENAENGKKRYVSFVDSNSVFESFSNLQEYNGRIFAIRKSFDEVSEIVEIYEDGSYKSIIKIGAYADDLISVSGDYILWSERRNDKRWEGRAWNDVYAYHLSTQKKKRISHRKRYFAPVKSPVANEVAVVEATETDQFQIQILDLQSGNVVRKIPNPQNGYIQHPCYTPDGESLVYVSLGNCGKELRMYNLEDNKEEVLIAGNFTEINYPSCTNQGIYFTASYNSQNNIYFYNRVTQETTQITNAMYGANYGQATKEGSLVFANYTADGYKPVLLSSTDFENINTNITRRASFTLADALAKQEGPVITFDSDPPAHLQSEKYNKLGLLFNFHSWFVPLAYDPIDERLYPGIEIMSQNILATSFLTAGIDMTPENRFERYYVNYSYEGWYPKLDLYAKFGNDDVNVSAEQYIARYKLQQNQLGISATFPIKMYDGIYYGGIFPTVYADWIQQKFTFKEATGGEWTDEHERQFMNFEGRVYGYRFRQKTLRDLYPKWGQYFGAGYANQNVSDIKQGSLLYGSSQFYFPGLFPHHSLLLGVGGQYKWKGEVYSEEDQTYYFPTDKIAMARGAQKISKDMTYADQMITFTSDYRFPLWYPDWNLGKFLYLKRVNLGVFYDFSRITGTVYDTSSTKQKYNTNYATTGGSIYFDFHPLRYETEVRLGVQGGFDLYEKNDFYNLIFSISL